jgi:hypothetical protein
LASFAFWSHKCAIFLALSEAAPSKRRYHKIVIVSYLQNRVAEWLVVILQAFDTNSTSSIPNADEESEDKRLPEEPCCPPASLRNGTAEEPGAGPEPACS